jgi:type IV secretory pathway VirB2 component (pilin)
MQSIVVLFIAFIALGLIFKKYDWKVRLLVLLAAVVMVIYVTVAL